MTGLSTESESWRLLEAASHALKSYACGNAAPDLAEEMAESIDRFLATGEPQTIVGKAESNIRVQLMSPGAFQQATAELLAIKGRKK
jgi:hypothetical protein